VGATVVGGAVVGAAVVGGADEAAGASLELHPPHSNMATGTPRTRVRRIVTA